MMQSSSDLSKEILKTVFLQFTNVLGKGSIVQAELFGTRHERLLYLRKKSNGTNKLTLAQFDEGNREIMIKRDASQLETETVKKYLQSMSYVFSKFQDSEGYSDLTKYFATGFIYGNGSFKEKMQTIFQLIDENGDGYLSKSEVEKFFRIILFDAFNTFKAISGNPNEFPAVNLSQETINLIKNSMGEIAKIFDISKLDRLVNGAFTADTNHDGLISYEEWSNWCETDHYKEEWGTISLIFDSYNNLSINNCPL